MAFLEDFTRASDENLEADANWTRVGGTAGSATVVASTDMLSMQAISDAVYLCPDQGSANHYTQIVRKTTANRRYFECCVRCTDSSNFIGLRRYNDEWQVYKAVAGTFTRIDDATDVTGVAVDDVMYLEADGNTITAKINAATIYTITEAFNNTETRQGLKCHVSDGAASCADDFEAGPMVAPALIDTIDDPVLDAEQDNAFTYSGFASGAPTSFTLKTAGSEYTSANLLDTAAGGSGTWDMPDVAGITANTAMIPFDTASWTPKTATLTNGTETATNTVVVNPKANWHVVEVNTPITTIGSLFYVAGGWAFAAPANTDQVYYYSTEIVDDQANDYFVIAADGTITTNLTTGSVNFVFWDATTGIGYPDTVQLDVLGGTGILGFYSLAKKKLKL